MRFSGVKIGFAITGSHCTIANVLPYIQSLNDEGARMTPILSAAVVNTDTRFGKARDLIDQLTAISGEKPLMTLTEVEPIGPGGLFDVIVVAPCTGNTMAKLALGLSDTAVTMACKAQLRNSRPVVLALSTNDGLSANARNLGTLLNRREIYFVPFGQDAPTVKQCSIISKLDLIPDTILAALEHRQLQPLLISYN
jgi:dipicolinate synthase subunit B